MLLLVALLLSFFEGAPGLSWFLWRFHSTVWASLRSVRLWNITIVGVGSFFGKKRILFLCITSLFSSFDVCLGCLEMKEYCGYSQYHGREE